MVVFGSINVDLVCRVERFPRVGETVSGISSAVHSGGKGANQALAAARAGAGVAMYGAVGSDVFADDALALLRREGVDLDGVARVAGATGCASILVDARGDNCIVVVAGANATVDAACVPDAALKPSAVVLLQHELPAAANGALIARAHARGARVLLNAAPARALSRGDATALAVLVVNEEEARALAGPLDVPDSPREFAASVARAMPALLAVVTLGASGTVAASDERVFSIDAPAVRVVDTTGAGDSFVGALAAALDERVEITDALRHAVAAGSLACTSAGAQAGMPRRDAIVALAAQLETRVARRC